MAFAEVALASHSRHALQTPDSGPDAHFPQLGGVRALAVALVLLGHFVPPLEPLGLGGIGVRIFFVLSGFLITKILLGLRGGERGVGIRRFYARRFLRIFPAYYATLIVGAALFVVVRPTLAWHALYISNYWVVRHGQWHLPHTHLWSLAIEEQFYLTWPWVIVFVRHRLLPWAYLREHRGDLVIARRRQRMAQRPQSERLGATAMICFSRCCFLR